MDSSSPRTGAWKVRRIDEIRPKLGRAGRCAPQQPLICVLLSARRGHQLHPEPMDRFHPLPRGSVGNGGAFVARDPIGRRRLRRSGAIAPHLHGSHRQANGRSSGGWPTCSPGDHPDGCCPHHPAEAPDAEPTRSIRGSPDLRCWRMRTFDPLVHADVSAGRSADSARPQSGHAVGRESTTVSGSSAMARLWPSWPGLAPPGRDCSRRSLRSVEGGLDEVRDVLAGRCSFSTSSIRSSLLRRSRSPRLMPPRNQPSSARASPRRTSTDHARSPSHDATPWVNTAKLFNSEETDLITETIYIPLLDEGISVSRPTQGVPQGDMMFLVLPTDLYSTEVETWKFLPGTVVLCIEKQSGDKLIKLAVGVCP